MPVHHFACLWTRAGGSKQSVSDHIAIGTAGIGSRDREPGSGMAGGLRGGQHDQSRAPTRAPTLLAPGKGAGRKGGGEHASCEEMNSQMPSEATMTNLSPSPLAWEGLSVYSFISGSGTTPKPFASPSPIERDIASPTRPLTHTREGGRPRGPGAETTPPAASMRLRSTGKSGLWSLLKSRAVISPLLCCPMTARESPEHATHSLSPRKYRTFEVLPAPRAK